MNTALATLQALINKALTLDPGSRRQLGALAGKVLEIHCTVPPLRLVASFDDDGNILLSPGPAQGPDAVVTGSGVALAALALGGEQRTLAGSGTSVAGDHALLVAVRRILQQLDLDWEAALATLVGDTAAHLIGEGLRQSHRWHRDARARAFSGFGDYLREESTLVVGRQEAQPWFRQVQLLSADADRLAARVYRLESRLRDRRDGDA